MAYRFDPTTGEMQFAVAPFVGYTFGPVTLAWFFKRNTLSTGDMLTRFSTSGDGDLLYGFLLSNNTTVQFNRAGATAVPFGVGATGTWYLVVITVAGAGTQVRPHFHNGTSWTHGPGAGAAANFGSPIAASDRHHFGYPGGGTAVAPALDLVAAGIKMSDSTDLAVETLSRTAFSAWHAFGFDWLIGCDDISSRSNVGTATGGNEIGRVGISLVADPPGWVATAAPAATGNFLPFM